MEEEEEEEEGKEGSANHALDIEHDWEETTRTLTGQEASIRLCVDGALRGGKAAILGIALYAYTSNQQSENILLYRAGRCVAGVGSAFIAELMALEASISALPDFLRFP